MKKYTFTILFIIIVATFLYSYYKTKIENTTIISQVRYLCDDNKFVDAIFYRGKTAPKANPGEPPVPTGKVKIILSDGRKLKLKQTISADGVRYSNGNPVVNGDETFVFWSKGNTALVIENGAENNYKNCIALAQDSSNLEQIYRDGILKFTIRYPAGYKVDSSYKYQGFASNQEISGVKFIIPESVAKGTNLSTFDTGVSIETITDTESQKCNAKLFLYPEIEEKIITDNNIEYSFASSTSAAAGNRYEEIVWAIPDTNPCIAVRYFIHYGAIENYPEGTVYQFDKKSLLDQFDAIRRSLVLAQ